MVAKPLRHKPSNTPRHDRATIRRQRALDELRQLTQSLHQRDVAPFEILLTVGRRAELLCLDGVNLPDGLALTVVRGLPGLGRFSPLDAWAESASELGDDAAEGIEDDAEARRAEQRRHQRAMVLASWLMLHAGSWIAEQMVQAAEETAAEELTQWAD